MKEPLRYPLKKIDAIDDYLKIDILKYIPPGLGSGSSTFGLNSSDQTYGNNSKIQSKLTIILPIPENIGDNNSADWTNSSIGPIEAYAASFVTETISEPKKIYENAKSRLEEGILAAQTGLAQQGFKSGAAALAIRQVLGNDKGQRYMERGAGITFNQNIELLFTGVKMRPAFTFSFDMIPRSKKESDNIKEIIRSFKIYSSASKGLEGAPAQGLFLKAPHVFKLRYMSGLKEHPFLNKFKICALVGMGCDYTAGGTYATYADGTPVNVRLNLSFQELTPIYTEDYFTTEEGGSDNGIGVGY